MQIVLSAEMFDAGAGGERAKHTQWLLQRYHEIAPVVLPDALRSIGTGEPLAAASLACIRASARSVRHTQVPVSVALRGAIPALRAFGAFFQSTRASLSLAETTVVVSRAGLLAHELGACWMEAWNAPETDPDAERSAISVETVAASGEAADPAIEMVALVAAGQSTEQIAAATAYSPQAVKWHLGRLMRSWNATNRPALVSVAFMRGLLITHRRRTDEDS
ncbi:helix-turn-helix transcriptional regulator [Conyzicola sp.]|uniref:helix-turn-helix transcriptional regulator n=1 Tax=Conyzicola sp. TaxID=1969404 RepID=UPI00398A33F2